mmetsp:Transcript_2754/g.6687  ORF Transcript_2754/g.6687 Transcript_2754/m.6687 type:complete len:220 (+) Transcript_2754:1069-1728(+)
MVAVDGSGLGHLRAASPVRRNRTDRATLRRAHRLARLLAHSSGCARAAATAEWGAVGSLPQVGVPAHYARAQDQVSRRAETSRLARLCDRARTQVAASTHLRSAVRCARGEQPPSGGGRKHTAAQGVGGAAGRGSAQISLELWLGFAGCRVLRAAHRLLLRAPAWALCAEKIARRRAGVARPPLVTARRPTAPPQLPRDARHATRLLTAGACGIIRRAG